MWKIFSALNRWHRELCNKRAKNGKKKVIKIFANIISLPLLCTRFRVQRAISTRNQGSWKYFDFLQKIFCSSKKLFYLCSRFAKKKQLVLMKNFLKFFREKFGGLKKLSYLCTTFRVWKSEFWKRDFETFGSRDKFTFFEIIEQLNKFSTLVREYFKQYLWDRAKI